MFYQCNSKRITASTKSVAGHCTELLAFIFSPLSLLQNDPATANPGYVYIYEAVVICIPEFRRSLLFRSV
jgi:hypothetical protein